MQPSKDSEGDQPNHSKTEVLTGAVVLICAQLAAASTAACVKALPIETPSVLRGLWRQTLTSFIFTVFTMIMWLRSRHDAKESEVDADPDEEIHLLNKPIVSDEKQENPNNGLTAARVVLVTLTVVGATLLNDTIIVALRYASSAAVMCLCNTTPIWLILYAIINCRAETPGAITIMGAALSLCGTIVCSTGEEDDGTEHENERLGAIIATIGAIGGAIYMTACRKLAASSQSCGLHPIHLSLIINIGMMMTTFLLCLATLPDGIVFFSTDISSGFFGFLNPVANPAALLHSIFPDLGGNFGIMLALHYFDPLIVSMVMLTEPLNASIIAMYAVHEAPPSRRTIIGVSVVLVGGAIVLWESNKDAKGGSELRERTGTKDTLDTTEADEGYGTTHDYATEQIKCRTIAVDRRRRSSTVLYSQLGTIAPEVAAKAACLGRTVPKRHSLPDMILRGVEERQSIVNNKPLKRYDTFHSYEREQHIG